MACSQARSWPSSRVPIGTLLRQEQDAIDISRGAYLVKNENGMYQRGCQVRAAARAALPTFEVPLDTIVAERVSARRCVRRGKDVLANGAFQLVYERERYGRDVRLGCHRQF
jgi:hypothetical protein